MVVRKAIKSMKQFFLQHQLNFIIYIRLLILLLFSLKSLHQAIKSVKKGNNKSTFQDQKYLKRKEEVEEKKEELTKLYAKKVEHQ